MKGLEEMKKLDLYFIDDDYITYLRKFDERVRFNRNKTRPYLGVVCKINGINYFAPLASPKDKHLNMNPKAIDIWKIADGRLGIININNMIPCSFNVLTKAIPSVSDYVYRSLLIEQLDWINQNKDSLYKKISTFVKRYEQGILDKRVMDRCCDFKLLEEKYLNYKK